MLDYSVMSSHHCEAEFTMYWSNVSLICIIVRYPSKADSPNVGVLVIDKYHSKREFTKS